MHDLPQRLSLVGQTATYLREAIAAGRWRGWLPAERALGESLQVSRSTLRRALVQLQQEGLIQAEHGAGNRILTREPADAGRLRSREVALLTPEPLERLRPGQALWIDDLRAMLVEHGCRLHVLHGQQYFRRQPAAALERLVRQHPHGCWILLLANAECQAWFARRSVPCVVAGSCSPGIDLPDRDRDHRATCRHAAGVLLGLGHRRLALVTLRTPLAGDLDSEAGFLEAVRASRQPGASATICHAGPAAAQVGAALHTLMAGATPPTGLLAINALHYLAVASGLARLGRRVPEEVSVISRDEDGFLSFVLPEPARYVTSSRAFARSLLQPVLELLEGGPVSRRAVRLMPRFVSGGSIGAPPGA